MNHAELLVDGHRILPRLLRDLEEAQRSIHVSIFLFFRDPIGEEIAQALARKAAQGVQVRVLLNLEKTDMGDPFSTGEKQMMKHDPGWHHDPTHVEPLCEWMRKQGIQVADTNIDYGGEPRVHDERLKSIHAQIRDTISISDLHVDHRKIIVIDGYVAYCGGANVGAQYLFHVPSDPGVDSREEGERRKKAKLPEPWWKWHDSLTRFCGPLALELEKHFRERWLLDGGDHYEELQPVPSEPRGLPLKRVEVLLNQPDDRPNQVRERYVELIRSAKEHVFIENPYLYHPAIVEALLATKAHVQLILPARKWNDNQFAFDAQQFAYARYLEKGIEVYEYQNHFNHLKIAAFDGRVSIHGSTNLNYRSLEDDKDFELNVCVEDEGLAQQVLREVRDADLPHCKRYTPKDLRGFQGRRVRTRDPRTMLLMSRKVL